MSRPVSRTGTKHEGKGGGGGSMEEEKSLV